MPPAARAGAARAGRLRAGRRPPRRADPPRRQARERAHRHDATPGRAGQGRRLRAGQGRQRRHPAHRHRRGAHRHRLLPRPRAGGRRPRRRPRRRLRRGRGALRAADRPQAARGRVARSRSPTSTSTRTCRRRRRSRPDSRRTSTRWSPGPPPATADQRPADAGVLLHQLHRVTQALPTASPRTPSSPPTWRPTCSTPTPASGRAAGPARDTARTRSTGRAGRRCWRRRRGRPAPSDRQTPPTAPRARRTARPAAAAVARRRRRRPRGRAARDAARCCSCSRCCSPCGAPASAPGGSAGPATPPRPACWARRGRRGSEKMEAAGLDVDGRRQGATPRPWPGRPGPGAPTRAPATRVLDGGTVTVRALPRQGALRGADAGGHDRGPGPGRPAQGHLLLRQAPPEVLRDRARGHRHRAATPRPAPPLRPGAAVDLVVSKGRRPIEVQDWTGKDADRASAALESQGPRRSTRAARSTATPSPRATCISQSPTDRHALPGRHRAARRVPQGPELVEVPGGLVASGVDAATEKLEALGLPGRGGERQHYIGRRLRLLVDPGSGSMAPKGSTVTLYHHLSAPVHGTCLGHG